MGCLIICRRKKVRSEKGNADPQGGDSLVRWSLCSHILSPFPSHTFTHILKMLRRFLLISPYYGLLCTIFFFLLLASPVSIQWQHRWMARKEIYILFHSVFPHDWTRCKSGWRSFRERTWIPWFMVEWKDESKFAKQRCLRRGERGDERREESTERCHSKMNKWPFGNDGEKFSCSSDDNPKDLYERCAGKFW